MRTTIAIVFTVLVLLRMLADGSIVDLTDGTMIRHPSLAAWYADQLAVSPQLTIKSASLSTDGKTVLILLEGEAQRPTHQGK